MKGKTLAGYTFFDPCLNRCRYDGWVIIYIGGRRAVGIIQMKQERSSADHVAATAQSVELDILSVQVPNPSE